MARRKRRSRGRARRGAGTGATVLGLTLLGVVAAILAGFLGAGWWLGRSAAEIDKGTFCPKDGPISVTAVLIDATDPLNEGPREAVRIALDEVRDRVPTRGALEVYALDATASPSSSGLLRPLVGLCNPGRGGEINPLYGNPDMVERRWRDGFDGPLRRALDELTRPRGEASASPIMEAVQSVAVTAFRGRGRESVPLRLVVVSDMLQHTEGFSHYRGRPDFAAFRNGPYYRKVRADLRGAEVELFYLRRDTRKGLQDAAHVQFWREFFTDQGGVFARFLPIEG